MKELKVYVKNGLHLRTGRPFKSLKLSSAELLVNWLICATLNYQNEGADFVPSSDPNGGDGLICDRKKHIGYPIEHTFALPKNTDLETAVLKAVTKKQKKGGYQYANGKILIVLLEGSGIWIPKTVSRTIPENDFDSVWIISLSMISDGNYIYNVVYADPIACPVWRVIIQADFNNWTVRRIQ